MTPSSPLPSFDDVLTRLDLTAGAETTTFDVTWEAGQSRRGLPARDDRFQEDRVLVLDQRHQVDVLLTSNDKDALIELFS